MQQIYPVEKSKCIRLRLLIIDDSRWVVRGPDLPKGSLVKVIDVKGSELMVDIMAPVIGEGGE